MTTAPGTDRNGIVVYSEWLWESSSTKITSLPEHRPRPGIQVGATVFPIAKQMLSGLTPNRPFPRLN